MSPEGPEVRRMVDQLREYEGWRLGRPLAHDRSNRYAVTGIPGMETFFKASESASWIDWTGLKAVRCHGKFIWFDFEDDWHLMNTLGMTGQWSVRPSGEWQENDVLKFELPQSEEWLVFSDQRHMGMLKFVKGRSEINQKLSRLGPDILVDSIDVMTFVERALKKPNRTVCEVLMDQSVLAGCGNYIKSETLFLSGVSPHRKVVDLSPEEFGSLLENVIMVAKASYAAGGAYLMNYRDLSGDPGGSYQNGLLIYKKIQCPNGHPVLSEETEDKRTSWWCEHCQK
jgi:DNA-formamidopyrimidine glycosylase